jgi:SAM-dependent methyltransferase
MVPLYAARIEDLGLGDLAGSEACGETMPSLSLSAAFPFPDMITEIAIGDTMFQGSTEQYVSVGLSALRIIEAALEGRPTPGRILDLPCGYGRITRILRARFPNASITVSDIDRDGVAFTSGRFRARGVPSSGDFCSLNLGGPFDLIWVGSLMTHLPEQMTRQFLDCLLRHMVPHTTLIMSSHGRWVAERMQSGECYGLTPGVIHQVVLQGYERNGYGYSDYHGSRNYGISLVSRDWIDRTLDESPLTLDCYLERAWGDHHDILVLRPVTRAGVDFQIARRRGRLGGFVALAFRPNSTGWFEARYTPHTLPDKKDAGLPPLAQKLIEEFNEDWYLATYTDVAAAVQQGHLRSALEHFKNHGWAEGRLPRAPQQGVKAAAPGITGGDNVVSIGQIGGITARTVTVNPPLAPELRILGREESDAPATEFELEDRMSGLIRGPSGNSPRAGRPGGAFRVR